METPPHGALRLTAFSPSFCPFRRPPPCSQKFAKSVCKFFVIFRALPSVRDLSALSFIEVAHIHPPSALAQIGLRRAKARFCLRDSLWAKIHLFPKSRKNAANRVRFLRNAVLKRAVNYFKTITCAWRNRILPKRPLFARPAPLAEKVNATFSIKESP